MSSKIKLYDFRKGSTVIIGVASYGVSNAADTTTAVKNAMTEAMKVKFDNVTNYVSGSLQVGAVTG